jgi:hypothetical protein
MPVAVVIDGRLAMAKTFAAIAALALSACTGRYGYAYAPYLGPHGHYVGPFEGVFHARGPACRLAYAGPIENGYRGPYDSGPYCVPVSRDPQAR